MEKRIVIYCMFLVLMFSCNSDYEYLYVSQDDTNNSFIIKTFENRSKIRISMLYQNEVQDNLYYLRVNDEFYQCDELFSKDSISHLVQFSTVKEYKVHNNYGNGYRLVIEKLDGNYITINNMTDYSGTIALKYFYDQEYKIFKIENMGREYSIKNRTQ